MSWLDYDDVDDEVIDETPAEPEAAFLIVRKPGGWQTRAACLGLNPDLFFPGTGESVKPAKDVCRTCALDVRIACLNEVLDLGVKETGVRAGVSHRERRGWVSLPREQVIAHYVVQGIQRFIPPIGEGRTPRQAKCGTYSGHQAHKARDEKPCPECVAAAKEYRRDYKQRVKLRLIRGGAS